MTPYSTRLGRSAAASSGWTNISIASFNSLKYMRIDPGLTKQDFARLTMEVLEANLPLIEADDDYWGDAARYPRRHGGR